MLSLFPELSSGPPGFVYIPNFISVEEENALLTFVRDMELHPLLFQGFEAKRKVVSFGYDYNFDTRKILKGQPIPDAFHPLVDKVAETLSIQANEIAEVLVTEYPPGAVINWHRDAPPFKVIAGISLLEPSVFKFRPHDKAKQDRKSIISIPVDRRSFYSIADEARSEWQHSISPVKSLRYSITLRTLQ